MFLTHVCMFGFRGFVHLEGKSRESQTATAVVLPLSCDVPMNGCRVNDLRTAVTHCRDGGRGKRSREVQVFFISTEQLEIQHILKP